MMLVPGELEENPPSEWRKLAASRAFFFFSCVPSDGTEIASPAGWAVFVMGNKGEARVNRLERSSVIAYTICISLDRYEIVGVNSTRWVLKKKYVHFL